ncbi:hypothetical protein O0L34_g2699 [Tuta absoluta]|nr:hypothetical protein O0L34_g2699 [Tuta absoluta]
MYWSAPQSSCLHPLNLIKVPSAKDNPTKLTIAESSSNLQQSFNNLALPYRPALWTQIRSSKGYPRFHRDMEYPNFDEYRKSQFVDVRKTTWGQGDEKPGITYALGFAGAVAAMYGAKSVVTHYVSYMSAAADVLALASVEVELSGIAPGACSVVKWRGKPLMIKNRTPEEIEVEKATAVSSLRDPESEEARTQKPEWLVIIGICTHLGCVPIANTGDHVGGFYCPCHGSHYDNLGRIRKGPAPTNMIVPPYKFASDTQIIVG